MENMKTKNNARKDNINEQMNKFICFARDKGYLTLHDISEHLPDSMKNPEDIEYAMNLLDNLEI
jgi:hypothetical protein